MPPNVHQYSCSVLAHFPRFSPPASPENRKYLLGTKRMMKFSARKIIPVCVFVLASFSILRLLRIAITTSSSPNRAIFPQPLNPSVQPGSQRKAHPNPSILTEKEFRVLSEVITRKAPCNVLIFGFEPQYLTLSSINSGGSTVILDDEPPEVYKIRWDVIVVDGPRGDDFEVPGRMGSIYTAAVLARAGNNAVNVFVHDVHRTVEKWFSWEFLCEENLVLSKGDLWNFRVLGRTNSSRFLNYNCNEELPLYFNLQESIN